MSILKQESFPKAAYWTLEAEEAKAAASDDKRAVKSKPFVLAEYVWLDYWQVPRSKTKVMHGRESVTLAELSDWNYDGSSTNQAPGEDSEVIIKPKAMYPDPFRGEPHVLVLCDTYTPKGKPLPTNTRYLAAKVFAVAPQEEPWYGIEQEYVMFRKGAPLGWPLDSDARNFAGNTATFGYPGPQGPYYCSNGSDVAFGREVSEYHLLMCKKAGLNCSGTNGEVLPGQWEYQIGPCVGIEAGDQHVMSRFLLNRVGEMFGVTINYEPKPVSGDWNGSGCHTNFSTKNMRENADGLKKYIIPAIERLGKRHQAHMFNYGSGNQKRLTGKHETASMERFSWGVANRGASVRVGNETAKNKRGYFEDRRPAANMDPYLVTGMIFDSAILNGKFAAQWPGPVKKLAVNSDAFSSEDASEGYASEGSERGSTLGTSKKIPKSPNGRKSPAPGGEGKGCAVIM